MTEVKRFILAFEQGGYQGYKGILYSDPAEATRFATSEEAWLACNKTYRYGMRVIELSDFNIAKIEEFSVGI